MEIAVAVLTFLSTPTGQAVLKALIDAGTVTIEDLTKLVGAVVPHAQAALQKPQVTT
jgi:hypothetical protein